MFDLSKKIGILGGGQLGKMLALAGGNWHLPLYFLDKEEYFSVAPYTDHFVAGDFRNYNDVMRFGEMVDVISIEIEHVNTDALRALKQAGKVIHPDPDKLDIIKDKGAQKQFYQEHSIPTSPFSLYQSGDDVRAALDRGELTLPFVQKARKAGYDGKGVAVIRRKSDLDKILPEACLVEELADIKKELAVIVARNQSGDVRSYAAVEMEFHPTANLVEFLSCPAQIPGQVAEQVDEIARNVIQSFDLCGLLAVEMFWNKDGSIWVNEVAPRPHNSGHHTIESCYTSQFEQHLRAILDLPLGSTKMKSPCIMVNLLGAESFQGPPYYEGMDSCLAIEGVKVHVYGKKVTKPFRKMGHATILADTVEDARQIARKIEKQLVIKSQ